MFTRYRPKNSKFIQGEIREYFPMFRWCKCLLCDTEFIFSTLWKFKLRDQDGVARRCYACTDCATYVPQRAVARIEDFCIYQAGETSGCIDTLGKHDDEK